MQQADSPDDKDQNEDETLGSTLDRYRNSMNREPDSQDPLRDLKQVVDLCDKLGDQLATAFPERIGKYEIRQPLSCGGQSSAWLAFDPELQRRVAIKRHRGDAVRARDEGRALARIRSPYVLSCYGIEHDRGCDYLVMEYCAAPTLRSVLADGPLSPREAIDITAKLADALSAIHQQGFVHGDVKPGNILVDGHDPRLIDFGAAQPLGVQRHPSFAGTAPYVAPELVRQQGERIDGRSDLFSLGAVLYEMLTGESPFRGSDTTHSLKRISLGLTRRQQGQLQRFPGWIAQLCTSCLAQDPDDRPPSAAELKSTIERHQRQRGRIAWLAAATLITIACFAYAMARSDDKAVTSVVTSPGADSVVPIRPPTDRQWQTIQQSFRQLIFKESDLNLHADFEVDVNTLNAVDEAGQLWFVDGQIITLEIVPELECWVGIYSVNIDSASGTAEFTELFPGSETSNFIAKDEHKQIAPIEAKASEGPELLYIFASTKRWDPSQVLARQSSARHGSPEQRLRSLRLVNQFSERIVPYYVVPPDLPQRGALSERVERLVETGVQQAELGRIDDAIDLLRQALQIEKLLDPRDFERLCASQRRLAELYEQKGQYEHAANCYYAARQQLVVSLDGTPLRFDPLTMKVRYTKNRATLPAAAIAEVQAASRLLADAQSMLSSGRWDRAVRDAEKVARVVREHLPRPDIVLADACYVAAVGNLHSGHLKEAERWFRESIETMDNVYGPNRAATSLRMIDYSEELEKAREHQTATYWLEVGLDELSDYQQHFPDRYREAERRSAAGRDANSAWKPRQAEDPGSASEHLEGDRYLSDSLALHAHDLFHRDLQEDVGPDLLRRARIHYSLAQIYGSGGFSYLAEMHLRDAFRWLDQGFHDDPLYAEAVILRGVLSMYYGRLDQAEEDLRKARTLLLVRPNSRPEILVSVLTRLGLIAMWSDRTRAARRLFDHALSLSRQHRLDEHDEMGQLQAALMEYEYRDHNLAAARTHAERSLQIHCSGDARLAKEGSATGSLWRANRTWLRFGDYLNVWQDNRAESVEAAYQWAQRIRGTLHNGRLVSPRVGAAEDREELQEIHREISSRLFAEDVPAASPRIKSLLRSSDALALKIRRSTQIPEPDETMTLSETARRIPDSAALVDIVLTSRIDLRAKVWGRRETVGHYSAFVIRKADSTKGYSIKWVELGRSRDIDGLASDWIRSHRSSSEADTPTSVIPEKIDRERRQLGTSMRKSIWQKLEPHLAGCNLILWRPAGRLASVPLSALPDQSPGSFLIDRYAFVRLAPAGLPAAQRRPDFPKATLVAVGGVQYGQGGAASMGRYLTPQALSPLKPLVATRDEIAGVQEIWAGRAHILQGPDASAEDLIRRLHDASVLHLATHSHFIGPADQFFPLIDKDYANPNSLQRWRLLYDYPGLRSVLALSGANRLQRISGDLHGYPGIMTAHELACHDLSETRLVVLSGCRTSLHHTAIGTSAFGLTEAFLAAGADSVVGSVWEVADDQASALMIEFYRNWVIRKMSRIEALRQAQISVRNGLTGESGSERRDAASVPLSHWAPWVLTGNWQ